MKKALILLLGLALCLTNGFANENPEGRFDFPTPDGPEYIQGTPEFQSVPDSIIGTADFEKMRDLPPNSQDYSLGRKVGLIAIPSRDDPDAFWVCTGFLVGPDLFMTTHRCIYDNLGLLHLGGVRIYMDYYQEPNVDRTRGGITAGVLELLRADARTDYALLRLDKPIGNTYGWLDLDATTRVDTSQSVKLISHPDFRSKEIVRRNSQIVDIVQSIPFWLTYLADTEDGSAGSPVFLREGTGVIGIHQSSLTSQGVPVANRGTLMSYIVPEIQQWLPGGSPAPPTLTATTLEVVSGDRQRARASHQIANPLVVRVRDQNAAAMSGVSVSFSVTPSGQVTPSSATTGVNGEAQTRLTLGSTAGTYTVTARATGITQPVTFTATATAPPSTPTPNDPSFNPSTVADQTFTVGTPVHLTLPVATGGTAPYTYRLSPIPAGLQFSPTTRLLSGTPTTVGTTSATYTVTDAANMSASLTVTIEVIVDVTLDVNGDGQVTVIDLAMVALFYGTQVADGVDLAADVNDDGTVNILDLTAVAQAIDAAGNNSARSVDDVAVVLEAIADIEGIAEAPARFSTSQQAGLSGVASRNVAAAFAAAKHLATDDARLGKYMPLLKELLQLLTEMWEIPDTTALLPNYPNPFNPETWIPYQLAKSAEVTLTIYAVNGQVVRRLALGHQAAGIYQSKSRAAYWDGKNLFGEPVASGLYFYTLTAGDFTATRKMLIRK